MDIIKVKLAETVAGAVIKHAELGTKRSFLLMISEPVFPIELLKEEAE
jgi:hypothetical protein